MEAIFNLSGKNAIVTGGGSGIGKAISLLFAKAGAHVFILELSQENSHQVITEVEKSGGMATFIPCDITQVEQVNEAVSKVLPTVDILINNAGIAHIGNLQNTSEADFERLFHVNVKGTYNCTKAAINEMVKQNNGVILNMASIAAMVGLPDRFAYSMTKGAVLAMTYSIARDYVRNNIRCNCISPARIHTPFVDGFISNNYPGKEKEVFEKLSRSQPIGRMGSAEEVAHMALYLCSDQASFITGTNFPIDGGFVKLNT